MLLPEQRRKPLRRPPPLPVPVKPPSNVARIVIVAVVAAVFVLSGLIGGLVFVVRTIDRVVQDANQQSSTIDAPPTLHLSPQRRSPIARRSRIDELLPEGRPAYTASDIEQWLPQIRQSVESMTDRKFKTVPTVKVIGRRELREVIGRDDDAGPGFVDDLPGEAEMTAVIVLGLYDPDDGTVYMLPGNLLPMMGHDGGDARMATWTAKLVLAHELTHALQDQELNLKHMQTTVHNVEERQALRATIEGHATMVEELIANRWGLERGPHEEREPPKINGSPSDEQLVDFLFNYQDVLSDLYYLKGSDFFRHNLERGGPAQVWHILGEPPKDTAAFMNPSRYWQPGQDVLDAETLLKDLTSYLGAGWEQERFTVGAFTLRLEYRKLGSVDADALVAAVQHARALQLQGHHDGAFGSVELFDLRPMQNAVEFVRWLERVPPGLLSESKSVDEVVCGEPNVRNLKGIEAKFIRDMKFDVAYADGRTAKGRAMRIGHGTCVLEIIDVGIGLDDQRCLGLANEVFRRVDQAKAAVGKK